MAPPGTESPLMLLQGIGRRAGADVVRRLRRTYPAIRQ